MGNISILCTQASRCRPLGPSHLASPHSRNAIGRSKPVILELGWPRHNLKVVPAKSQNFKRYFLVPFSLGGVVSVNDGQTLSINSPNVSRRMASWGQTLQPTSAPYCDPHPT